MESKRFSWVNNMFFRQLVLYPTICFIAVCFYKPAFAEFYRYVDEHGNVMFTDDLSKVPADQREKVKSYEEAITQPPPAVEAPTAESTEAGKTDIDALQKERERLRQQENALNQEYKDLMKMRSQLNEKKGDASTDTQVKDYNQQVLDLNERIQNYEKKRDALANEVDAFNKKVEDNLSKGQKNKGE